MKKSLSSLFALLALVLVFGLSSCDKATSPVDTVETEEFAIPAFDASASEIYEAGIETEMSAKPPVNDYKMHPFGLPVRELKLTKEQMDSIKPIMMEHRVCVKSIMDSLRHSEMAIIKAANTARKAIMDEVKAGTMAKDSARTLLAQLNRTTREQLKTNPVAVWARTAIKECDIAMFTAIRALLTDEQKVKFDKWLNRRK